jgi:CubicO group peptidase (beta-lactamase class C family)
MRIRAHAASLLLCSIVAVAGSSEPNAGEFKVSADEALKKIASDTRTKFKLPGICIALLDGDRSVRIAADGIRKVGEKEPVTVGDKFHLGSCTKAMTATMIASVIHDTKLEWDSTVADILPDIAEKAHPDFQKVTVRQLVDHTSGLPKDSSHMFGMSEENSRTENRRILFTKVLADKPRSKPGEKHAYSNLGFMLAGLMAETAADMSWRELMTKYLFKPLNMKSAGFGPPGTKGKIDQPWGHASVFTLPKPLQHDNPEVLGPAGRVHCTLADWARFASLHLGHIPKDSTLKKSDLKLMHSPAEGQNYSAGWIVVSRPWAKGEAITHSGSNTMWYALVWIAPELDKAFLVATNSGQSNAFPACDAAVSAMILMKEPQPKAD